MDADHQPPLYHLPLVRPGSPSPALTGGFFMGAHSTRSDVHASFPTGRKTMAKSSSRAGWLLAGAIAVGWLVTSRDDELASTRLPTGSRQPAAPAAVGTEPRQAVSRPELRETRPQQRPHLHHPRAFRLWRCSPQLGFASAPAHQQTTALSLRWTPEPLSDRPEPTDSGMPSLSET